MCARGRHRRRCAGSGSLEITRYGSLIVGQSASVVPIAQTFSGDNEEKVVDKKPTEVA
jgi:predicted secreted protein